MQTFLPESTFTECAAVLDNKRLNKQLLEGRQILTALLLKTGWVHHPATLMWKQHESNLVDYLSAIRDELDSRGIAWAKNWEVIYNLTVDVPPTPLPYWWSDSKIQNRIIATHRGRLYAKNSTHYIEYFDDWTTYENYVCCTRCNYYWPTHIGVRV